MSGEIADLDGDEAVMIGGMPEDKFLELAPPGTKRRPTLEEYQKAQEEKRQREEAEEKATRITVGELRRFLNEEFDGPDDTYVTIYDEGGCGCCSDPHYECAHAIVYEKGELRFG